MKPVDHAPLREVLVPLSVAMFVLQLRRQHVEEMVQEGALRWVFDVSAPAGAVTREEWRFWIADLYRHSILNHLDVDDALAQIVRHETETWLSFRTVGDLLWVARPHLNRLANTGELPATVRSGIRSVRRCDLYDFLERRLVK